MTSREFAVELDGDDVLRFVALRGHIRGKAQRLGEREPDDIDVFRFAIARACMAELPQDTHRQLGLPTKEDLH